MMEKQMRPARRRLCAALMLAASGASAWAAAPPTLLAQAGAASASKADERGVATVPALPQQVRRPASDEQVRVVPHEPFGGGLVA